MKRPGPASAAAPPLSWLSPHPFVMLAGHATARIATGSGGESRRNARRRLRHRRVGGGSADAADAQLFDEKGDVDMIGFLLPLALKLGVPARFARAAIAAALVLLAIGGSGIGWCSLKKSIIDDHEAAQEVKELRRVVKQERKAEAADETQRAGTTNASPKSLKRRFRMQSRPTLRKRLALAALPPMLLLPSCGGGERPSAATPPAERFGQVAAPAIPEATTLPLRCRAALQFGRGDGPRDRRL